MVKRKSTPGAGSSSSDRVPPKKWSFKSKNLSPNKGKGKMSSMGSPSKKKDDVPADWLHKCVKPGTAEETGNALFVFNPKRGQNDRAKEEVQAVASAGEDVSGFKKELGGFTIKAINCQKAQDYHTAFRNVDNNSDYLPAELDLQGWVPAKMAVVKATNVNYAIYEGEFESARIIFVDGNACVLALPLLVIIVHGTHRRCWLDPHVTRSSFHVWQVHCQGGPQG